MSKPFGWTQIAIAYLLLETALWTEGGAQQIASLAAALWIVLTTLFTRRSPRQLGLGAAGFRGALIAVPIAAVAAAVILTVAWLTGTLHSLYTTRPPLWRGAGYAIWSLVQEFILNSFFYVTLEELLHGPRNALLATVVLFSAAHLPNLVLVAATVVAAVFFVSVFQRWRNIYPLAIAHAMLGLSLAASVPDPVLRHMRVGIGFLHFVR